MTHEDETRNFLGDPINDDYDDYDDEPYCYRCDGTGFIMICPDDLCRGSGECIHGDGEVVCPVCKGRCAL